MPSSEEKLLFPEKLIKTPFSEFKENINWEPTERVTTLSKFLFRAPDPIKVSLLTLPLALGMGLIISFSLNGFVYGIFLFALPAYASAFTTLKLIEYYGERFFFRRAILTSFAGLLLVAIVLVVGTLLHPFLGLGWRFLVIYGYCLDLAMRYLVVRTSCIKHRKFSLLVSSLTLLFVFLFFLPLSLFKPLPSQNLRFLNPEEIRFTFLSILALLTTSFLFIEVVNAPMKSEFGIEATDLLGYYLSYMTNGTRELEKLFHNMEEEMSVPLHVMVFRRVKDKKIKLVALLPGIHPGPVGDLGGGDLPAKMERFLGKEEMKVMCFHGCSTNDFNPVDDEQVKKVAKKAEELIKETKDYTRTATKIKTLAAPSTISVQIFGKYSLIFHESVDSLIDDINIGSCLLTDVLIKDLGLKGSLFIDCHNHADKRAKALNLGNPISTTMVQAATRLSKELLKEKQYKIMAGYGEERVFSREEGIGGMGVQTLVIELKTDEVVEEGSYFQPYRLAFVLCDGNNMLSEFKTLAERVCLKKVDEVKVLTTDNHVVNAVIGGYNPIGEKTDKEKFLKAVNNSLKKAIEDIEEVEIGFNSSMVHKIKVIGYGNSMRLATVINNTVALTRQAVVPFLLLSFLFSLLAYYIA